MTGRRAARTALAVVLAGAAIACGKKGPPLPPLVHVPAPPADFAADRRGNDVALQFTVPSANTDGSRPANLDHVDVYGFTGPPTATDDQLIKFGSKIATVSVRAPKNPEAATAADEPPEEPELEEDGIDQGARAQIEQPLTPAAFAPVTLPPPKGQGRDEGADLPGPLAGPAQVPRRLFLAVGVSTKGRRGPPSRRTAVPLVPPPSPPSAPAVTYDERAIHLAWKPSFSRLPVQPAPAEGAEVLPARFFGMDLPSIAYRVYDVSPSVDPSAASPAVLAGETRLTGEPLAATAYDDTRMEWGRTRCYAVRTVETIAGQTLESDATMPACVTPVDTFPPSPPKNLRHIASDGVISLIWEPDVEADVTGYVVLRGVAPGGALDPITPAPITVTVFDDRVPAGTRYVYAVEAVDRAGNRSAPSDRVEDAAR